MFAFDWLTQSKTWRHANVTFAGSAKGGPWQRVWKESFQNREFEVKKVLKLIACRRLCVNMAEAKTDKAKVALITGITGQVRKS